jgi:hypothetical protein
MSSTTGGLSWARFKRFLFASLALMFAFVLWHNERFIFDHSHPDWQFYFPVRWWLLPHGFGGLIALIAGPFQFSSRFRQRHLRLHRIMGRCYLSGIGLAAAVAVYLALTHTTLAIRFFAITLAAAWLLTTSLAFVAVRKRNILLHRQWMVRSYALTTTFVTARVLTAIPAIGNGGEEIYVPAQWALLIATLVFTEVGLAWRGLSGRAPSESRDQAMAVSAK